MDTNNPIEHESIKSNQDIVDFQYHEEDSIIEDCFNLMVQLFATSMDNYFLLNSEKIVIEYKLFSAEGMTFEDESHLIGTYYEGLCHMTKAMAEKQMSKQQSQMNLQQIPGIEFGCYYIAMMTNEKDIVLSDSRLKSVCEFTQKQVELICRYSNRSELLIKALDSITDGISFCNANGKLVYVNDACCNIMGVKKEDLLNRQVDRLADDKPMLMRIMESKKSIIDMEYIIRFNGNTINLIDSGYPVFGSSGEIIGAIDIFRGIERSRKLANRIAGYQAFFTFDDIVGESAKIKEVISLAKIYSNSNENILIMGESGTGKELVAQAIHNHSLRKNNPFIALNCANFPNDLIDSELFGYEEGAFTGAKKGGKPGKFELADGGTIFLDEIGEMQIHLQAKLLRILETMSFERISGSRTIYVNVRIIAATNRDLEKLVEEGKFRMDLYYRLNVLLLKVPPLRERGRDKVLLADYFIKKHREKSSRQVSGMTIEAKELVMTYPWTGNIRELENTFSRVMYINAGNIICKDTLIKAGLKMIKEVELQPEGPMSITREILVSVLHRFGGNKKRAAEELGISRPTLYKMIKNYDI